MNYRKWLLFSLFAVRGQPLGKYYHQYLTEYQNGIPPDTIDNLLRDLLHHCEHNIPYYSKIMKDIGESYLDNPREYLKLLPLLTKDTINQRRDELKSVDLSNRKWYLNSTGGSTGTPVQFIQDREYAAKSGATKMLYSKLTGKEVGELEIRLWGSLHDIQSSTENWRARLINRLENTIFVNSSYMTPDRIREFIRFLDDTKPKLMVAYAEPLYEIAKFMEREDIKICTPLIIITSAGKLSPFMREKIEQVFRCCVFDRYGSREAGDIACEKPGIDGLWVAPWGNYIEIVDSIGNRVPNGSEGDILITSLRNYAMPLIRYKIEDRGILADLATQPVTGCQVLQEVIGRTMDLFKTKEGGLINPGFFMANLYFRDWIARYQVVQKDFSKIVYKIIKVYDPPETELAEITSITKNAMGKDCEVHYEFVENIPSTPSGKYRFLISELS